MSSNRNSVVTKFAKREKWYKLFKYNPTKHMYIILQGL